MTKSGVDLTKRDGMPMVDLDLATVPVTGQEPRLSRAAWQLGEGESLRVRTAGISWAALASLSGDGFTYRLLPTSDGLAQVIVWRRYTDDEHRRYLRERLRARPGYPANAHTYPVSHEQAGRWSPDTGHSEEEASNV